ncbi:fus1 actin binding protein [Paramarasmius palmivorus]|uniref:Fus1 actin binding protein n=1 Tax=Paramarasmius palmivorus TaxID=297713 RepID=A0AAW0C8I9_9AGAR
MIRGHVGRGVHAVLRRAPHPQGTPTFDPATGQAISTEQPGNDYAKQIVANTIPPSTIALAVVLAVSISPRLHLLESEEEEKKSIQWNTAILCSQSTEHLVWLREGDVESSTGHSTVSLEKPDKAFIPDPFPYEQHGGWVPQIRNYRGVPLKDGQLPGHVKAAREGRRWLKSLSKSGMSEKSLMTPPPSYVIANGGPDRLSASNAPKGPPGIPLPPTPPDFDTTPPTPPTPPATQKLNSFKPSPLSKNEPSSRFSVSPLPPRTPGGVEPLPSPARSTSFAHQQQQGLQSSSRLSKHISSVFKANGALPLPRLMTVINTFEPSLDDELLVKIGDTVRLLEEYNDGWCLAQIIGKADSPRGVVPRFCLVERESVIPTSSAKRNLIKSIQVAKW